MNIIINFFKDSIVIGWIAPIVATVLGSWLVNLIFKKRHTQKTIDTVTVANSKILDAIRPLFIQKIHVDKNLLQDIISAVSIDYDLDIDMLINIKQIKEKLVYDISVTRFMDEKEKIDRIENLYKTFSNYEYDDKNCYKDDNIAILNKEREKLRKLNKEITIFSVIISTIVFIGTFSYNFSTLIEFINNNFSFVISLIGAIVGV
ncbi:hypothetical protein, partial [Clostridium perfringens]|uniref:hypothetical protein n=1 Tax=Clostridium perfringens TaxID=1502 RepID=UPI003DA57382